MFIFGVPIITKSHFMKKIIPVVLLLLAFVNSSCSFTERIDVKADGSGEMAVTIDGAELMKKAGEEIAEKAGKRIDSTISFRDVFKDKQDSIAKLPAEERDAIKKLENVDIHLLMDASAGEMLITMKNKFKNLSELGDAMQSFNKVRQLKKGAANTPDLGFGGAGSPETSYTYDGKKFKRTVKLPAKTGELSDDTMKIYRDMFAQNTYTMVYSFLKPVKSVSDKEAKVSADGKTVTITRSFADYMDKPESLNLEVSFGK